MGNSISRFGGVKMSIDNKLCNRALDILTINDVENSFIDLLDELKGVMSSSFGVPLKYLDIPEWIKFETIPTTEGLPPGVIILDSLATMQESGESILSHHLYDVALNGILDVVKKPLSRGSESIKRLEAHVNEHR